MEWLARIPNESPAPVLRISTAGDIWYRNPASVPFCRQWHPEDELDVPPIVRQAIVEACTGQKPVHREMVFGKRTWRLTIAPALGREYVNLFADDITERKRAEEELRWSREHLAWVLDKTGVGTWLNELPLSCLNWDTRTHELFFIPPDVQPEIDLFWSRLHPEDREPTRLAVEQAMRDGSLYAINHRAVNPETGEVRWIRSIGRATYAADGTPIRFDGINYDITQGKQAEEELHGWNMELEERVAERTAELECRAHQLQKLTLEVSQAEDRERRRMAEILHDDLQQQLASAKFHLTILKSRAKGDPTQQEMIAHLDGMLMDAIEKSRSLSHELSPAILYSRDLAETFRWLAEQTQANHGLTVHVAGRAELGSDPLKAFLYKTGQELLFNAVKHAGVGAATIRVRQMGPYVGLTVSDRGRGFDPEALSETGGFGLFSIRERVGLLGGRMKIRSAPGEGSRFLITVPDGQVAASRGRSEQSRRASAPVAESPSEGQAASTEGTIRVMVADDHEIVRQGLTGVFAHEADMELVGEAANGREAVDLAYRLRPDVVVMDISMPLMDGVEATRQIKIHLPSTRVIGLSMNTDARTAERLRTAGAEACLSKTGASDQLLATIRNR